MVRFSHELFLVLTLVTAFVSSQSFPGVRRVEDFEPLQSDPISYRLPQNVRPLSYDVHLRTNVHINETEFSGTVIINLDVFEATTSITLHHRQLTILGQTLVNTENNNLNYVLGSATYNTTTEFLTFPVVSGTIPVGTKLTLSINFSGSLRNDAAGFYRSTYVHEGRQMYEFIK